MALNDAVPSSATDVFKRNAEDTDRLLNSSVAVTNRLGNQLLSWEQISQSHAAWNNRGAWTTATAYSVKDIWQDGGIWYVVLSAYTSGASAAADIAGTNVAILQSGAIFADNYQYIRDYSGLSEILYAKGKESIADGGQNFFQKITGAAPATYADNGVDVIVPTGGDGSEAWLSVTRPSTASTVADLRLLVPTYDGQQVELLGHTLAGIGGGDFYAILNDTSGVDNNGTKFMTAGGHSWNRKESDDGEIKATSFGLYDGASEGVCSSAVQGIIDYIEASAKYNVDNTKTGWGCKITFPSGRFPLSGVVVSKFNFIFEGVGHSTYLVNENTTGVMIDCSEASGQTLGGISFRDLHVRNVVNRAEGAGPIIFMDNPVRSSISNVLFTSSAFNTGSRVALRCDMLKTIAPFEFLASEVVFYGCDVAWEMVSDSQSDTVDLQNVVTNECAIGLLGFVGAGGSGNNNFKFSGKFIGSQGGLYVSSGNDAFAETTVVSTSANDLTVASSTNMQVGRAVVVGTDNTVEWAIIKSISGNTLSLDRPITKAASTRVLSGRFGAILCEMRNPNFSGVQLEGLDVGILMLTGSREITVDGFLPSSTAKVFYGSSNFRRLSLLNGSGGALGTMQNGVTFKMLTIDDGINGDSNKIYFDIVPGEGSDYYDGTLESLVDNIGVYDPQIEVESRFDGDVNLGDNSKTATEYRNKSYLAFNRTRDTTFTRMTWQNSGVDQWFNNFSGPNGDLQYKLNGQSVNTVTMQGFNGDFTVSDGAWDSPLFRLGAYRLWVDATGSLRIKNGTPTSDTDGSVVGSQS